MRFRTGFLIVVAVSLTATPAWAPPVVAAAATFIATALGPAGIGLSIGSALAISSFVVTTAIGFAVNTVAKALFGPKQGAGAAAARQAQVLQLSLGETPRQAVFGRAVSGGSLDWAFYWGGDKGTDWNAMVIDLAAHRCDALEGVFVNETYVPFAGDGPVDGYGGQLEIYWRPGTENQDVPSLMLEQGGFGPDDNNAGNAYVLVAFKIDAPDVEIPIWGSRPVFKFQYRGALCYDPRKDSTVEGGSGPHRWGDPSTREWSENAEVCHYTWQRGLYACDRIDVPDQLMIGRGMNEAEAYAPNRFAAMNLCDEAVDDGNGGTEGRYRVGGVLNGTDDDITNEEYFAAAMAGVIVQRAGSVEIEPGQDKSPVMRITVGDFVKGTEITVQRFDGRLVNTVVPRYTAPDQGWAAHEAPASRNVEAILADGPEEQDLTLTFVTSGAQAQRCADMTLKRARFGASGGGTLGPRFQVLEDSDWIEVEDPDLPGGLVVAQIQKWAYADDHRMAIQWQEIALAEGVVLQTPGASTRPSQTLPLPLQLSDVAADPILLSGADGEAVPAVRFTWAAPPDPAILRIRAEVRRLGQTASSPTLIDQTSAGVAEITNGVVPNGAMEARLVPMAGPGRSILPSPWIGMDLGALIASDTFTVGGVPAADIVADLQLNAENIALGSLRGTARDAFQQDMLYLRGQPVGVVVDANQDAQATVNEAFVSKFDLMGATINGGTAWQFNASTVYVAAGVSLSDFTSSVSATLGSHTASITTLQSVQITQGNNLSALNDAATDISLSIAGLADDVDSLGSTVTSIKAKYAVVVNTDGHVTGFELISNGTTGAFYVVADQFGFVDPGHGPGAVATVPFSYAGGLLRMHSVEVDTIAANVVDTQHLIDHSVSEPASVTFGDIGDISNESTVATIFFDPKGGGVDIEFSFYGLNTGLDDATMQVTIYKNGTPRGPGFVLWPFKMESQFATICNGSWTDEDGSSGTQTYQLNVQALTGNPTHGTSVPRAAGGVFKLRSFKK